MNINPPWSRGDVVPPDAVPPADLATHLYTAEGAAVSVGPPPGMTARRPLVLLGAQAPGATPAVLRLRPEEARRLAQTLTEAADAQPAHAERANPAAAEPTSAGADRPPERHERYVVAVPEGCAAAELRRTLAPLPAASRLVDFSSDTDVVLVFATDDPRWPSRSGPAR
ncbi:conserved hypothetical protein [Frankia canadensis]|uniref:Uncharacterized protein n=1 Tax=Frankia canadensis TaxID=1836972 RepID=A0A2I2KWI0_9ACTN|nr:hypothetical protein [Frankia canadensis]SNQ50015.1 conserved hypothetical protein [Frankia canadensis]SOU57305.1 conserved hypothetical protein [Frankia canadensis]